MAVVVFRLSKAKQPAYVAKAFLLAHKQVALYGVAQ